MGYDNTYGYMPPQVGAFPNEKYLDKQVLATTMQQRLAAAENPALGDVSRLVGPSGSLDLSDQQPSVEGGLSMPNIKNPAQFGAIASGVGDMAGGLVEAIDNPQDGKSSVGASVLKGGGKGAAIGTTLGGPIGTAAGAVIGGAIGGITASIKNKKIDASLLAQENKESAARITANYKPMINTQAPIYQEGTPGSDISHLAEVERDELVLRKDAKGKFRLIADFRGGKAHSAGGELTELKGNDGSGSNEEGDIVFPKEKRKEILSLLKSNDHTGIESARLQLPEDSGQTIHQAGVREQRSQSSYYDVKNKRNVDRERRVAENRARLASEEAARQAEVDYWKRKSDDKKRIALQARKDAPAWVGKIDYDTELEALKRYGEEYVFVPDRVLPPNVPMSEYSGTGEEFTYTPDENYLKFTGAPNQGSTAADLQTPTLPSSTGSNVSSPRREDINVSNYKNSDVPVDNKVNPITKKAPAVPSMDELAQFNLGLQKKYGPTSPNETLDIPEDITTTQDNNEQVEVPQEGVGVNAGAALNYLPAALSFIDSLKAPERVNREVFNPKLNGYTDMSANQRAEINRNQRVQNLAADRYSGGSSQTARARKEFASGKALDSHGRVNAVEAQRADAVNQSNVGILNNAQKINIDLENQYEDLDARNRAAVEASAALGKKLAFDASVTNMRDRRLQETQDVMEKLLGTRSYGFDENRQVKVKSHVTPSQLKTTNYEKR